MTSCFFVDCGSVKVHLIRIGKGLVNFSSKFCKYSETIDLSMVKRLYPHDKVQCISLSLYRMSSACQKKCIPPKYREGDLTKGEAVCLDRCVAKFLEVHDRIGKKLTSMYLQDEQMMKQMQQR